MKLFVWIPLLLLSFDGICADRVRFTKHPANQTVSQGNGIRLGCAVQGLAEPDVTWRKDGEKLYGTDQMFITLGEQHWETFHSVKSVQQQDAGQYWCEVELHGLTFSSDRAWIMVEGVPHFVQEPQDVSTLPNVPFNLSCSAVGPPDPVQVVWWVGGVQEEAGPIASPSVLHIPGVNTSVKFYCEAQNARGISVSRTATVHIKALPAAPNGLEVLSMVDGNVTLSWQPGFDGHSALSHCVVQLTRRAGRRWELPQQVAAVPPHQQVVSGLRSHCNYSARVSCVNEVGPSPFSPWLHFRTPESVPEVAPANLSFRLSEQQLLLSWEQLEQQQMQGNLLAYRVQWSLGGEAQEPLLFKENSARLSGAARFFNASFQVAACTAVGCGPWSPPVLVLPTAVPVQAHRSHLRVGVLLGLLLATMVALALSFLAHRRGKEMHFGSAFKPPEGDALVSFTAARSFNRGGGERPDTTLDSLGINNELKNKLQDVLIPERQLTLGHMLGKGEFGSVREALLKTEDSVQQVAVKVLKSDITSSADIEQCLKEAAYMKDFHHPNVIQLIGVSLQRRAGQRLPVPMVVLPFMKHGDLHTFLLLSRLGEQPFDLPLQTLLQFMLDVSRGMDYLSSKSIIHRDLAARNCMLDENMTVCVADFGLSKKIYSGDYYRQGSVSKLPVKWIALESLADNVYTTQSDVWAFGVTMWEIMTRGQTPYPGVENSEIYEYLIKGERLKKPADCMDDIYEVMHSCWSPVPKCRPSFQQLVCQLESLLSSRLHPGPLHYVNLEGEEPVAPKEQVVGLGGAPSWSVPWQHRLEQQQQQQQEEEEERDWLISSGAALAIGGDYRYIIGPCGGAAQEEDEVEGGGETIRDEEDDIVIDV